VDIAAVYSGIISSITFNKIKLCLNFISIMAYAEGKEIRVELSINPGSHINGVGDQIKKGMSDRKKK